MRSMQWSVGVLAATVCLGIGLGTAEAQIGGVAAGVVVDADGVLRTKWYTDPTGVLVRERLAAAKAAQSREVAAASKLRMISLNRLEAAIRDRQGVPTDEMKYLAGLQRIAYVFAYPETHDLVIAGPAEGWYLDLAGRPVGVNTGRPVVQLQDLVVALRAFPPGSAQSPVIGCSIDPTEEGLATYQQFLRNARPSPTPAGVQALTQGLRTSLGLQTVSVNGVPARSRFAQVLVEADYRMKLIGIGLEQPPVKLTSFIEKASPSHVGRNALMRWYFVPDYQCVRVTEDRLSMQLVGDGVKLVGEDELVSMQGQRTQGGATNRASATFVNSFTKAYPELAARAPVYAELRNLIDIAIAAAFVQEQDYYGLAGWKMEYFGDEQAFAVETYDVPKTVESIVNAVWKGNTLMTPIGGGVEIRAREALRSENLLPDEKAGVAKTRAGIQLELKPGQWWWD